MNQFIYQSRTI